eukprot:TRINITY_DN44838_c0_g1_i5.p1 TRINITY_DN44838_c0_g1~~TRINITY_DN44838_c0_g1_i5.p1  ORF type:complete len:111 (-),score=18.12 TRINITY_DN44838_c0_g1_i5:10-303(-)
MGAGTPAGSDAESNASASGIVQGHAYALLKVVECDNHRLVQLRNPWGRKEWNGDWSDKSTLWTRRMKVKLNFKDAEDEIGRAVQQECRDRSRMPSSA